MTSVGTGQVIYDLRKKIQSLSSELAKLNSSSSQIPELINSANLLRSNESLNATLAKQSEIIKAYENYAKELEKMLNNLFEIQMELKEILKLQTSMISEKSAKKKSVKKPKK